MKKVFFLLTLISLMRLIVGAAFQLIYKKRDFPTPFISFLAASSYFLPLQEILQYYKRYLGKIPILNKLFFKTKRDLLRFGVPIKIRGIIYFLAQNKIITAILPYRSLLSFLMIYFIIIKAGRENNIPYFIRYNAIHALLICILQLPVMYFHEKLIKSLIINEFLKQVLKNLEYTIIILNFSSILFIMFLSSMGYYIKIPILTEASKRHVGKFPKYKKIIN